jgi:excisionase family DNA binding protein
MARQTLSVDEAAQVLSCSPRTIRRRLRAGVLPGVKLGWDWVVWGLLDTADTAGPGPRTSAARTRLPVTTLRKSLREVGARLIAVGIQVARAHPGPGTLCLAGQRAGGLRVVFAIGRRRPTQAWAPMPSG